MSAPNGAKLEVTILIDSDKWDELLAQGYGVNALQQAIEKSITFKNVVGGVLPQSPILDIESVTLQKYY